MKKRVQVSRGGAKINDDLKKQRNKRNNYYALESTID